MTQSQIEGGCLCGAVRYRASGAVRATALCHCRSCRVAAGGTSVAWVVTQAAGFAFEGTEPTRFASSPGAERTFCGRCGTSLTYRSDARPDVIDISTVTLDDPEAVAPQKEIWTCERLSWSAPNAGLPQFERSSVARVAEPCG